jgi:hypothetical protein
MKNTLLLILACLLFFACNKDDEPTPENWTEKDNIFRCKVNGVDWESEGDGLGFSGGNLDIYYENTFLNLIQFRATKDRENISQFINLGIVVASGIIGDHVIAYDKVFTDFNCGNYYQDTLIQNIVDIDNIDSINNIIEGTFNFTANEGSSSTCSVSEIVVTDGYFKAKYRN